MPAAAHLAAHWSRHLPEAPGLPPQAHHQLMASGIDQSREGGDGGLAVPGLIGTDHALRNTRPGSQFRLRQASPLTRLAEQRPSRHWF